MDKQRTTIEVQRYLYQSAVLKGHSDAQPVIFALPGRSARRLQLLCSTFLHRSYLGLARPPVGLAVEDSHHATIAELSPAVATEGLQKLAYDP